MVEWFVDAKAVGVKPVSCHFDCASFTRLGAKVHTGIEAVSVVDDLHRF